MRVKNGNGVFSAAAGGANTGGGVIDSGSVANPAALNGHSYTLTFGGTAANPTYDVYDNTAGASVSTGNAFASGQAIVVAGMQFTVTGNPSAGDTFTVAPSANQSMFKTIADAVAALRGSANASVRTSQLNSALASLDQAMTRANTVRAELGSRMNEIEAHANVADQVVLEHQKRLSDLQDLDYTAAASSLMRQQTATEAAQQTFAKLAKLSLFNYLG
jgi:flagellar hook-associated protein 3 FlgL